MKCLLYFHLWDVVLPNRTATGLPTLTDDKVAVLQSVSIKLVILKTHLTKFVGVKVPPSNISVSKVWTQVTAILLSVEHLAQTGVSMITKADRRPPLLLVLTF